MNGLTEQVVTISLDESGEFEQPNYTEADKLVFVAGVLYKSPSVGDTINEYKRVAEFFKKVCEEAGTTYPDDLHVNPGNTNSKNVGRTKECYKKHLAEYLQKGTLDNKPVTGPGIPRRNANSEYYIYEILRTLEGKQYLINNQKVSTFIKEDDLSNLYLHMSEEALLRTVLYNPRIPEIKTVRVDLATRTTGNIDRDHAKRYSMEGFNAIPVNADNMRRVELTNQYVFRTALEREMLNSHQTDIQVDRFDTRSIKYNLDKKFMEMLYLADAVCTYMGRADEELTYSSNYAEKQFSRMKNLIGGADHCLLFLHDDADMLYEKVYKYAHEGSLYHALSRLYDLKKLDTTGGKFYQLHWFKVLNKFLKEAVTPSTMTAAIRMLDERTRNNNIDVDKLQYIFDQLNAMVPLADYPNNQDRSILYKLYQAGVSIYNHHADTEKVAWCRKESEKYEDYYGVTQRIRARNKEAVALGDMFRYKEAEQIAKVDVDFYKDLIDLQECYLEKQSAGDVMEYGITLSQYAQILAFQRKPEARQYFKKALKQIPDHTPNYSITESYLLHHYIDMGDETAYAEEAQHYFNGNKTIENQLRYVIQEGGQEHNAMISLRFALYILIRAADTFYANRLTEKEYNALITIENTLTRDPNSFLSHQVGAHPWELIYRHLASLAWKHEQNQKQQKDYRKKLEAFLGHKENVIDRIARASVAEIDARIKGQDYKYPDDLSYMYC